MKEGPMPDAGKPRQPDTKRPYHVGVAVGVSAGVYAASMLATTQWQIEDDRALIADRRPVQTAIDLLDGHHDRLEIRLDRARLEYTAGATGYDSIADRVVRLGERLQAMDRTVRGIERLSASLSVDLSLPAVAVRGRGGVASSSARSGGNGGGSRGSVKPAPAPAPVAAKPPPVSGNTGASGGG
jgi:hypothetical protein